ncbi:MULTISPECIES: glutathione-disulfide reductase [Prochlorococcus]|uniref:glutathione-disulfide reductase n=1 Tax=Prochlorococcus TaxID=1218 RepID=UPI000533BA98|nr:MULTISPECIES: glutathione-disulfide reductase [Prochlorococcus]KGG12819.1 Glutathione reductase [Prochlorococcus sp. MIT 0601]
MDKEFDLVVLGAGSGGLAAAKRAAKYGAHVGVVEGDRVGGTCVIRGCVPKKLLVYGSKYREYLESASSFGVDIKSARIDSSVLLANVRREVQRLNEFHIQSLKKCGVKLIHGWGSLKKNNCISVENASDSQLSRDIYARNILIAVGGRPILPKLPGSSLGWVSDDMFLQNKFPNKILIVGAGFIACEFACILNGLGVETIQLIRGSRLLKGFDKEISTFLAERMQEKGINLQFNQSLLAIKGSKGELNVEINSGNEINCEGVLFATGRRPFLEGLNLDVVGINYDSKSIKTDFNNATNIPGIFAIGDVTDKINLTPVAIEEGRVLADNLFGGKSRKVDYRFIPKAVFSQPEIASVGLTEEEAIEKNGLSSIKVFRSKFRPMSQSLQKSESKVLLKLIIDIRTDKVLGCHIAGEDSAEIIQMASIAISMGAKKADFDKTMALHPTIAEEFVTIN